MYIYIYIDIYIYIYVLSYVLPILLGQRQDRRTVREGHEPLLEDLRASAAGLVFSYDGFTRLAETRLAQNKSNCLYIASNTLKTILYLVSGSLN